MASATKLDWSKSPEFKNVPDCEVRVIDYIPAGSQGAPADCSIICMEAVKENLREIRQRVLDNRDKPATLVDVEVWEGIKARQAELDAMIFEAFGLPSTGPVDVKDILGKKGRLPVSVVLDSRGGKQMQIRLPRNVAPQGSYILEVLKVHENRKQTETNIRHAVTLTLGFVQKDSDGKPYTPMVGLDSNTYLVLEACGKYRGKFVGVDGQPTKAASDPCAIESEDGKGFSDQGQYMEFVKKSLDITERALSMFGVSTEQEETKEGGRILKLQGIDNVQELVGRKTKRPVGVRPFTNRQTGDEMNAVKWPMTVN